MSGAEQTNSPTSLPEKQTGDRWHAERFRPTLWSALQARRIKLWLTLVGKGLLRFNIEVEGLELVPRGEPLIVAAAPHRNWIDPFLILLVLPPLPRTYFLAAADTAGNRRWKRLFIELAGGMVPVSTSGHLNRDGLEVALGILERGNRVGIFPQARRRLHQPALRAPRAPGCSRRHDGPLAGQDPPGADRAAARCACTSSQSP
jgi:1-acyl-sn-glycerol-3-phosphate acyltransferase